MQSISNQKGAFQREIRCHFGESATQRVTLKDVFIKKSEHYIVHLANFHTNVSIPIFMEDEEKAQPSVEFLLKDNAGNAWPHNYHVNNRLQNYSKFFAGTTKRDASIAGFIDRLRDFVERFNYKLNIYGGVALNNGQDVEPMDPGQDQNGQAFPPFAVSQHDPIYYVDPDDVVNHIQLGLSEDGKLVFNCSRRFLSNFYISFGNKFQKFCGFESYIWASTVANALVTSRTDGYGPMSFIDPMVGQFTMDANAFIGAGEPLIFPGTKSAFSADTRISIDVEATLPLFNSITSEFAVEKHEFLLERFSIPDYQDVETSNTTTNDLVITGVDFEDGLMSGVKDLVRDPHTHVIGMRAGRIQALNVTLWIRYMLENTIKKTQLQLRNNEWVDFSMVFTKKV